MKSAFNNAAGFALSNRRKICANKPIIRVIAPPRVEIICELSSRAHALQVQYQLGAYSLTVVSTSRWGIECVDAGAVDQAAHRVHLLSTEALPDQGGSVDESKKRDGSRRDQ